MKARRGTNCIWLVDPRDGKELRRLPLPMRRINSTIYPPRRMHVAPFDQGEIGW